ncbi:MAG: PAS domain S-box protein [Candidatus Brocadiia bacterium]
MAKKPKSNARSVKPAKKSSEQQVRLKEQPASSIDSKQMENVLKNGNRYRNTLNNMLEGCQIISFDWRYLYINEAATRHGQRPPAQLLNRTMMECYPEIEKTEMFAALKRCMDQRIPQQLENEFSFPDGSKSWFELSIHPAPEGIFILSLDITERKHNQEKIKYLNNILRAIRNVNQLITRERDRDKLIREACGKLTETRGYLCAWIILFDKSGKFTAAAESGLGKDFDLLAESVKSGRVPRCLRETMKLKGVRVIADTSDFCRGCFHHAVYPSKKTMLIRLEYNDVIYGILAIAAPVEASLDQEEQELFGEVSGDIAFALYNMDVEEKQKQSEKSLKESEEKFRIVFDNANDGILLADAETRKFHTGNKAICRMLGYTLEEIKGLDVTHIHPEKDVPYVMAQFEKQLRGEIEIVENIPVKRKNSSVFYADINSTPLKLLGKTYLMGIFRDITERKRAEETLAIHSLLLDNSMDSIFLHDDQGRFIYANKATYETRGYTREEFMKLNLRDLDTPEYARLIGQRMNQITEKGSAVFEAAHRCKDGSIMPIETHVSIIELSGKKCFLAVLRDITERKKTEEILRNSEKALSEAQKIVRMGNWEYDTITQKRRWSDEMFSVFSRDQRLGAPSWPEFERMVHPDDWPSLYNAMQSSINDGTPYNLEFRVIHPGGKINNVLTIGKAGRDTSGKIVKLYGTVQDITEQKQAQKELERSNDTQETINNLLEMSLKDIALDELLKNTLNMILAIPWLSLKSRGCIFLVESEPDVLVMKAQQSISDALLKTCVRVPFGKCICGKAALTREVKFTDRVDQLHEIRYNDIIPHGHYCVPIIFDDQILGLINIYVKEGHRRDQSEETFLKTIANTLAGIIDRRKMGSEKATLQNQLFQAQKMDAFGRLAGGVAHDFNNILTVIDGYCALMKDEFKDNQPLVSNIQPIRKAVERAANLTGQLLAFSRKQPMSVKITNLNNLITEMVKMLQRVIGEDIKLIVDLFPELKEVRIDQGQIGQVIMNLVINARDAMPSGGQITIKTGNTDITTEQTQRMPESRTGFFVRISVQDAGVGMNREIMGHLFEPFFTTKERGKGTGLGLSVVYGIVKQHNGWIDVRSEMVQPTRPNTRLNDSSGQDSGRPGGGTVFDVYLPVMTVQKADKLEDKPKKPALKLKTANLRILLIEDEEDIKDVVAFGLRKSGYHVFEAASVAETLRIFEQEKGKFDVVFSDIILPDGNGVSLVKNLLEINPQLKVILSSGYIDDRLQLKTIEDKGYKFISKPYNVTRLVNAILKS